MVHARPPRHSLFLTSIVLPSGDNPLPLVISTRLGAVAPLLVLLILPACGEADPTSPNTPSASIATPVTGETYTEGDAIRLSGSGTDPQDGPLSDSQLVWNSSIDGDIGTGASIDVSAPSIGLHTFTLTATDSDGNAGSASVSISVSELAFIDGTVSSSEIGVVVNSTANALRLFQVGDPTNFREIPLGASSAVTSTGVSLRGDRGIVPLGNAASVAVLNMRSRQIVGYYLFDSGNATGSAFIDDETVLAANQTTDEVGRFRIGQADNAISDKLSVTQFPNDIVVVSDSLALVVSANLDDGYAPSGEGMVTAINPRTMTIVDTVRTGGTNPQFGALGPNGLFYVVNTGDYVNPSSLVIIDPHTMAQVDVIPGFQQAQVMCTSEQTATSSCLHFSLAPSSGTPAQVSLCGTSVTRYAPHWPEVGAAEPLARPRGRTEVYTRPSSAVPQTNWTRGFSATRPKPSPSRTASLRALDRSQSRSTISATRHDRGAG